MENLLTPRYEVIASYPLSRFPIGTIIYKPYAEDFIATYPDYGGDLLTSINHLGTKSFSDYPNIFKLLQWWEKRKGILLPLYISLTNNAGKRVYNIPPSDYLNQDFMKWKFGGNDISKFLPATIEEYNLQNPPVNATS